MEFMSLATLMEKDTTVLLLALLIISIVNTVYIAFLFSTVKGIKKGIVWSDTYASDQRNIKDKFDALSDKVERLERVQNGAC